jgi:mono/diheme cytochrome c family protein
MQFSVRGYVIVALVGLAVSLALLGRALFRREEPSHAVVPASSVGRIVYETHCVACHGPTGKGDGPGARVIRQPMRDFSSADAMREVKDRFLFEIIKKGSSQFGRSNAMPSWGMKLSDDEIHAVVAHIRSFAFQRPSKPDQRKGTP